MFELHSYPSIFALGHKALSGRLTGDLLIEEKVDGSQFSFGVDENGDIHVRSKGAVIVPDAPEKMFAKAVETVRELSPILHPGWCYRGEYLQKSKHNTLAYSRIPCKHIILFDVNTGLEEYLSYEEKAAEAERIGLEVVPRLKIGTLETVDQLQSLLSTGSVLGGPKIEGVVVKPAKYDIYGPDKKVVMGKYVSEAFKEIHGKEWKKANPSNNDILDTLGMRYKTEARWQKAVRHLADLGRLSDSPKDIGSLMTETIADVEKECEDQIKDELFRWAWPHVKRKITNGLPEWYKLQLAEKQFSEGVGDGDPE